MRVKTKEDVLYTIEFISWLKGEDQPTVLERVEANTAIYKIKGNELFVRAKIISNVPKHNPFKSGDVEVAWTQPKVIMQ